MRAAGITIRKLTLLRDALQLQRNHLTGSIAFAEAYPDMTTLGSNEVKDMRVTRARIDTALEELRPAIVALTSIYSRGWLDMTPEDVASSVKRGRPQ